MDKIIKELIKHDIETQAKNSLSHDELLKKICPNLPKLKTLKKEETIFLVYKS